MLDDTSKPFTCNRTFPFGLFYAGVFSFVHTFTHFYSTSAFLITSSWCSLISHTPTCIRSVTHARLLLHILAFLPFSFIVWHSLWPTLSFSPRETMERSDPGDFLVNQWVITCVNIQSNVRAYTHGDDISARSDAGRPIIYHLWFILRYTENSHYWDKRRRRARH